MPIYTSNDQSTITQYFMQDTKKIVFTPVEYATTAHSSFPIPYATLYTDADTSTITITVEDGNVTQDFYGLCLGDVNGSGTG
jgi:hypothetical protein